MSKNQLRGNLSLCRFDLAIIESLANSDRKYFTTDVNYENFYSLLDAAVMTLNDNISRIEALIAEPDTK